MYKNAKNDSLNGEHSKLSTYLQKILFPICIRYVLQIINIQLGKLVLNTDLKIQRHIFNWAKESSTWMVIMEYPSNFTKHLEALSRYLKPSDFNYFTSTILLFSIILKNAKNVKVCNIRFTCTFDTTNYCI